MTDLEKLSRLAKAATPGPWRHNRDNEQIGDVALHGSDQSVAQAMQLLGSDWRQRDANAAFIAAANPTAVLALIDEIEGLRAAVEALTP